ncbi:MAG: M28 family peptidase [Acidobacteria bacterium]|nr:M28 family peptidase [Acidobacteriota bacterium]
MQGLGLTVSYHNWSLGGYSNRNVVGQKTGTTSPNEIVLITAHLDDMPSGSTAPGADDNASGSVGVMLSAELLSVQQFARTIRFVFFTGEEQGIYGSQAYSDLVYGNGDNIVAVYNMDMISYDGTGAPYLRLHTRTSSNPGYSGDLAIANTFVDVVNAYSLSSALSPIITSDGETRSDHSSFWDNSYYAILGIEDHINDMTPYYHTTSDTVTTLNWTYYVNFVKATIGTASHLAIRDNGIVVANFTASPTSGVAPLNVTFTDQSTGATSWSWNFGDSGTSTVKNPVHTYTAAGTYTVALTVSNGSTNDTETKVNYITVTGPQPPVANFTASSTSISIGENVIFTDTSTYTPTSWSWTFEGGTPTTSTAQNPTVTYNTVGTYDVTLVATNAQGSDSEVKVDYITVGADAIAEGLDYTATFTKSGNANWTKVTDVYYYGNDSAKSGTITHSQTTSIETIIIVTGPKVVKFYWKVSSESGYDYLRFYIDGVQKNQISGTVDWAQVSNNITAGTHTLKWTYLKDASVSSGSDCGWVDKLEIVDGGGVTYCTASSTDCSDEWIARVRVGTLDKSSTASTYTDFTSTITNYTRGASQSVTLTPGFSGSAYTEYWRIFVDYNKDGDFADTGETAFSKSGSSAVTGSFTIPSTASTGNTRMRVTMRYGSYATSCGSFTYGEVEDYTANIL